MRGLRCSAVLAGPGIWCLPRTFGCVVCATALLTGFLHRHHLSKAHPRGRPASTNECRTEEETALLKFSGCHLDFPSILPTFLFLQGKQTLVINLDNPGRSATRIPWCRRGRCDMVRAARNRPEVRGAEAAR